MEPFGSYACYILPCSRFIPVGLAAKYELQHKLARNKYSIKLVSSCSWIPVNGHPLGCAPITCQIGVQRAIHDRELARNRMNVSSLNQGLTLRVMFQQVLSKLHETLVECNLKEFSNITNSVNP